MKYLAIIITAVVLSSCTAPLPRTSDGSPDLLVITKKAQTSGVALRGVDLDDEKQLKEVWKKSQ